MEGICWVLKAFLEENRSIGKEILMTLNQVHCLYVLALTSISSL